MTGAIEFEQLIKPKFHQWMDFLRAVSTKGAREREFLRRLRSGGSLSLLSSLFVLHRSRISEIDQVDS